MLTAAGNLAVSPVQPFKTLGCSSFQTDLSIESADNRKKNE